MYLKHGLTQGSEMVLSHIRKALRTFYWGSSLVLFITAVKTNRMFSED